MTIITNSAILIVGKYFTHRIFVLCHRSPRFFLLVDTTQIGLMKITVPKFLKGISFLQFSVFILMLTGLSAFGQTQKPSVTTGVTFQWSDTQANNNDPATINSITINGAIYGSFAVPSSYAMTRVGPVGHHKNYILENGVTINNNSSNPDWDVDALAAYQDKNMNHYFGSSHNGRNICNDFVAAGTTDAQIQSLYYSPGIPSNEGGVLGISDRNANNCYYLSVYGIPANGTTEQFLGDTFVRPNSTQWGSAFSAPPAGVDYWNSGRVVENGGSLGIALFTLDDMAPVRSTITRVDVMAATNDHGDGKVFLMQRYAMPRTETQCKDVQFNGTIADSATIPGGSSYSLVSGPVPAGLAFTFNSDGTYSYTPTAGYLGDVVFEYQVCLPAPNSGICDVSTVTISYVTYPNNGCPCNSGNAAGPLLQNN